MGGSFRSGAMRGVLVALAATLSVAAGLGAGPVHPATVPGFEKDLLYVTNQGEATVAVVDMEAREVVETVDLQELGYSERAQPHHAVAEPDGSAWYVSLIAENAVLKFDRDNELVGEVETEAPGLLAVHPSRDELYVARSMMAVDPPPSITVTKRSDFHLLREVDVFFPRPHAMALSGDGRFAFSASLSTNQLMGVDTETDRGELTTLDGPTHVVNQMAVSPDGARVVATGQMTGELLFFRVEDDGRLVEEGGVAVGAQPWHPTFGPEGRFVYVPNKESNTVSVVDADAREVVETLEDDAFAQPHGSALSGDGRYLFVSNNHQPTMMAQMAAEIAAGAERPPESPRPADPEHDHEPHEDRPGTLAVIDLETLEVVDVVTVGMYATGVGTRAR